MKGWAEQITQGIENEGKWFICDVLEKTDTKRGVIVKEIDSENDLFELSE